MSDIHDDGMRTLLAKRAAAGQPVAFLKDGQRWELPADGDLTEALIWNAGNLGLDVEFGKHLEDHEMETDIIKTMDERLAEIRKADPTIRSDQQALLKLAESRSLPDQQLWREYKSGTAPSGAVAKEFDAGKAIKKMAKRCDEIMAADSSIKSRASAIGKIATSRDPDDLRLWQRYRAAGQVADTAALHSSPTPVGKGLESVVFDNMCRAIRASFPGISDAQVRQWADLTLQGKPPKEMLIVRTRDAA